MEPNTKIRTEEIPTVADTTWQTVGNQTIETPPVAEAPEPEAEPQPVAFPIWALNEAQRNAVMAIAETYRVEPALAATISLAGLAGAIGLRYYVEALSGRPTYSNLYSVAVAPRAYGKSSATRIIAPILNREKFLKKQYADQEAPLLKITVQKSKRELKAMIEGQSPRPETLGFLSTEQRQAQIQLSIDKMELELKCPPSLVVGSATGPSLIEALKRNNGEAFSFNPEAGDQIRVSLGRYTTDGKGDFELLLSAYSVEPFSETRISRGSTYMDRPCMTVFWMTQPSLLQELLQNKEARGRGLLARFLFMAVVQKEVPLDDGQGMALDTEALVPWENLLTKALDERLKEDEESMLVGCEQEAVEIFRGFHNWTVERRNTDCTEVQEELGRARENSIRIALGQCIADAHQTGRTPEILTADHARRGVELADYYYDQYLRMLRPALMDIQLRNFRKLRDLCLSKGGKITLRDLKNSHCFAEEDIERTVELFPNQMRIATTTSPKGGRPSPVLELLSPAVM